MLVVMQMNVVLVVLMVNLIVVMVTAYLVHGHVTAGAIVQMAQMKLTVVAMAKVVHTTILVMVLLTVMLHGVTSV
jgi:hypothetical protein